MVNFMCQLDCAKGCPEADKTFFLGVSVKVFPEEISIWICRLSKGDHPYHSGWAWSSLLRAWKNQKVEERWISSWIELGHLSFPALRQTLAVLDLRTSDWDWITPLDFWFSSLWKADSGASWKWLKGTKFQLCNLLSLWCYINVFN